MQFGDCELLVGALAGIIKSKNQPVARAIGRCWRFWSERLKKPRMTKAEALKRESARAQREFIRRLLALPPEKRMHFLRKRVGIRMTCL